MFNRIYLVLFTCWMAFFAKDIFSQDAGWRLVRPDAAPKETVASYSKKVAIANGNDLIKRLGQNVPEAKGAAKLSQNIKNPSVTQSVAINNATKLIFKFEPKTVMLTSGLSTQYGDLRNYMNVSTMKWTAGWYKGPYRLEYNPVTEIKSVGYGIGW